MIIGKEAIYEIEGTEHTATVVHIGPPIQVPVSAISNQAALAFSVLIMRPDGTLMLMGSHQLRMKGHADAKGGLVT